MTGKSKKEHKCFRCGRVFARAEHLQRHERSHTKEKPFVCGICQRAFTRRDLLTRHNRLCHENPSGGAQVVHTGLGPSDSLQNSIDEIKPLHTTFPSSDISALEAEINQRQQQLRPRPHPPPADYINDLLLASAVTDQSRMTNLDYHDPILPTSLRVPEAYGAEEFTSFLDAIAIPSHPFSPSFQPLPFFSPESPIWNAKAPEQVPEIVDHSVSRPHIDHDASLSRFASRLPSLAPEERQHQREAKTRQNIKERFAKITAACRNKVGNQLAAYTNIVSPDYLLPSRHALTRFVTGYVNIFHEHYPWVHLPTFSLEQAPPELFLAIAALGAQYCFEREKGIELFYIAKAVAYERLHQYQGRQSTPTFQNSPFHKSYRSSTSSTHYGRDRNTALELMQTFVMLTAVSMWSEKNPSINEALSMRSTLVNLMRDPSLAIEDSSADKDDSSSAWVQYETIKRTKYIAFCFFNLQTITFDAPPMIMYRDLRLSLPSSEKAWRADTFEAWLEAKDDYVSDVDFQNAFECLFDRTNDKSKMLHSFSTLGGHVLIHAVIQHIWLLQQAANLPARQGILPPTDVETVEVALKRWAVCFERDQEASVNPLNPNGPLSFTSTALLRLAYIRANIDLGTSRCMSTWDPDRIALFLRSRPPLPRNEKTTRAALHCAHLLSVPIKLGLNYVARTQVYYWSNQYALCSLESALLLSKWLETALTGERVQSFNSKEQKVLDFVLELVAETEYNAPREQLVSSSKHLSIVVVRLWSKLFKVDSVWELIDLIGKSLRAYADLVESELA